MNSLSFADHSIEITEIPDGLLIQQGSESYKVTKFLLTPDLEKYVKLCIGNGLTCAIRYNHPRPNLREKGVGYIGFSRDPSERWVCVVDINSPRPKDRFSKINKFTFEKSYRIILEKSKVKWEPEWSNCSNIWVSFDQFESAVVACSKVVDLVENSIGARQWEEAKHKMGFVTEALLESWVMTHWRGVSFGRDIEFVANQINNIDILAYDKKAKAYIVFELKRGIAGIEVLEQLDRYMADYTTKKLTFDGKENWGALIARSYKPEVVSCAKNREYPVRLYTFQDIIQTISLETIFSSWPSD